MQFFTQDDEYQPIWQAAQRFGDFVLRETSSETLPCKPLRGIILCIDDRPGRMNNRWLEVEIRQFGRDLRRRGYSASVRRDVRRVIGVLERDVIINAGG